MCLSTGISKLLLVVFNIVFFVLGLGLLILGIVLVVGDDKVLEILGRLPLNSEVVEEGLYRTSWLTNFAYALIVAGVFFFAVGGAGLFGACCKVKLFLVVYSTVLVFIIALEIAIGILAWKYTDKVENYLLTFLIGTITSYYQGLTYTDGTIALSGDSTGVSDAWDYAHVQFSCCGANNYTDFAAATLWPGYYTVSGVNVSATVPASCCQMVDATKWPDSLDQITYTNISNCIQDGDAYSTNTQGCYQSLYDKLREYSLACLIMGLVVGLIEILGLWASCSLYKALGKETVEPV